MATDLERKAVTRLIKQLEVKETDEADAAAATAAAAPDTDTAALGDPLDGVFEGADLVGEPRNPRELVYTSFMLDRDLIETTPYAARHSDAEDMQHAAHVADTHRLSALTEEHNADINAKSEDTGLTALQRAAMDGNLETVRHCMSLGADPNLATHHGHSPLILAAWSNRVEVMEYLLEHAVEQEQAGAVEFLLTTEGINVPAMLDEITQDAAWTPLMMAAWRKNAPITKLLLDAGANLSLLTRHYETAEDLARQKRCDAVVGLITMAMVKAEEEEEAARKKEARKQKKKKKKKHKKTATETAVDALAAADQDGAVGSVPAAGAGGAPPMAGT